MTAPEEPFVGGKRRGVCCFQYQVPGLIDEDLLLLGEFPPEQENEAFFLRGGLADHGVCEFRPSDPGVAHWLICPYGEGSIEEQDALFGPMGQVAMPGDGHTYITLQFLENIDQRWRWGNAVLHGKAQSMRLSGTVIGILAQQYHLQFVERGCIKCVEDQASRRVDCLAGQFFRFQKSSDLEEIVLFEFLLEHVLPAFFDFYVHIGMILVCHLSGRGSLFLNFSKVTKNLNPQRRGYNPFGVDWKAA